MLKKNDIPELYEFTKVAFTPYDRDHSTPFFAYQRAYYEPWPFERPLKYLFPDRQTSWGRQLYLHQCDSVISGRPMLAR